LVQLFFSFPKPVGQDLRLLLSFYLISLFLFLPKIRQSRYFPLVIVFLCFSISVPKPTIGDIFVYVFIFSLFVSFSPTRWSRDFCLFMFSFLFLFLFLLSSVRLESDAFHITRLCQLEKNTKKLFAMMFGGEWEQEKNVWF